MVAALYRGVQSSHFSGFSYCGTQAPGHPGSMVVVRGLNYPAACGNFPDQGLNLCPLRWQVDS